LDKDRNQKVSKLLFTTPSETEQKMAELVLERICVDMAEHYLKMYSNEGPGALIYMPEAEQENQAFYLTLPALLQAQHDFKSEEQEGPAEVMRKAIVEAEALVPGKSALFIIQDSKQMRLINYKIEQEKSPLFL
jgi:propanediol dehydratase large subunit